MTLAELQSRMQEAILKQSGFAKQHVNKPPRGTVEQGLAVYQNAYASRLTEFLAHDYPVLRHYMGAVRFEALAQEYIAAYPSEHPNARWYSRKLPAFVASVTDAPPELSELALLERALSDAFDAADVAVLDPQILSQIPAESVTHLRFKIHESLQILTFSQNTSSIWSAIKCEEAPPPAQQLEAPQHVMVWRQSLQARMRILSEDEYMAIIAIGEGASFSGICEMLAMRDQEEDVALRAATYLRGWLEAEILSEANWAVDLK